MYPYIAAKNLVIKSDTMLQEVCKVYNASSLNRSDCCLLSVFGHLLGVGSDLDLFFAESVRSDYIHKIISVVRDAKAMIKLTFKQPFAFNWHALPHELLARQHQLKVQDESWRWLRLEEGRCRVNVDGLIGFGRAVPAVFLDSGGVKEVAGTEGFLNGGSVAWVGVGGDDYFYSFAETGELVSDVSYPAEGFELDEVFEAPPVTQRGQFRSSEAERTETRTVANNLSLPTAPKYSGM